MHFEMIDSNRIGDKGVTFLVRADWKNLLVLDLGRTSIGSEGIATLIEGKWPHLDKLVLGTKCNSKI